MASTEPIQCDLMVIGAGMAGMAAAGFAACRGIDTVQAGITGEIIYASGLLDLMGVHPVAEKRVWADPWAAVTAVRRDIPEHPYARLKMQDIAAALEEFMHHLGAGGLPYRHQSGQNSQVITPIGTVKSTYGIPDSMWGGIEAWQDKRPCLIADFKGLKGFSARQIVATLQSQWPSLRSGRIEWPEIRGEVYAERLARQLELDPHRHRLAQIIGHLITDEKAVGLPAVLGIENSPRVVADLADKIGCPVFEMPTLPPAVTGIRLREALVRRLSQLGVRAYYQMKVLQAHWDAEGGAVLQIGRTAPELTVKTHAVVLASGRFIGQGLAADRSGIRESVLGLPVVQPAARSEWHQLDFLDPRGHAINRCGVLTDNAFRPIDPDGGLIHPRLFAVGSILAHADWMRMKCGSGLAIATAYAAVKAYLNGSGQASQQSVSNTD